MGARHAAQPFYSTPIWIAGFGLRIVDVAAFDPAKVNLPVAFGRIDHDVTGLDLVDETEQLAGVVGNRARLLFGIHLGNVGLESVTVGLERAQVAHLCPANRDAIFLEK